MKSQELLQVWALLKDSANYRVFMKSYMQWKQSKKRKFSYAKFAREAGFTARSYPRDVIQGNKNLTAASMPKFIKAMKLTGEAAHLFYLLVCKDRPELFEGKSPNEIFNALAESRQKLARQIKNRSQSESKVYSKNTWPLIYASLGSESQGATLSEVSARARLSAELAQKFLDEMQKQGVVSYDDHLRRYFSKNSHLIFQDQGGNSDFKNFFLSSLKRAENNAKNNFVKTDRLFFASAVSLKRSDLNKYRAKLRELLNSFAEAAENPDGDEVVTIVSGFFPGQ
jgi:uncharacterized protein (TIGR02147 family)